VAEYDEPIARRDGRLEVPHVALVPADAAREDEAFERMELEGEPHVPEGRVPAALDGEVKQPLLARRGHRRLGDRRRHRRFRIGNGRLGHQRFGGRRRGRPRLGDRRRGVAAARGDGEPNRGEDQGAPHSREGHRWPDQNRTSGAGRKLPTLRQSEPRAIMKTRRRDGVVEHAQLGRLDP
jgi:hypothetical protein